MNDAILDQSLSAFEASGACVEIAVPFLGVTLWLAADGTAGKALGVDRGRVWLVSEVRELLRQGVTKANARALAEVKARFNGALTEIRPEAQAEPVVESTPEPAPEPAPTTKRARDTRTRSLF